MLDGFSAQQLSFLVILVVAFGLLLTEKLRNDLVGVLIILSLAISGILTPEEAFSGFGSEPAIIVAAIFVLSGGLHQTGLSETIGGWIGRLAGAGYHRMIGVLMSSVALFSAFTHHLTTTAVMLPVTLNLSRERDIPPSKLLMPLSIAASLGTTITIIGAPAFLIARGVLQRAGRPGLGIYSIAPVGLAISIVGTLFIILTGRWLLPDRERGEDPTSRFRLEDYFTEIAILPGSPFEGQTIDEVKADGQRRIEIVGLLRNGRRQRRPAGRERLRERDVLLVRTTPEELVAIRQEVGIELSPAAKFGADAGSQNGDEEDLSDQLVQTVIAPGSELVGRTLADVEFRDRFGAVVLSIWRQDAWLDQEMSTIKLRAGDVLVLEGSEEALERVQRERHFLMLVPFQGELRLRRKARLAGLIMLLTVLAAAFNILSIEVAAVTGAAAMVLTRCLTGRQAYRAIDARIYVFIAGALPLGTAMQATGASELFAGWLHAAIGGWSQPLILLTLFSVVAVLTQFMSDAATTALFAPVAVALAQALGQAPEAFVVTVAMASVAAFLTPIGHHGNLLIYAPGRYHFADFVRVGAPLTVLIALIVAFLAPLVWPG